MNIEHSWSPTQLNLSFEGKSFYNVLEYSYSSEKFQFCLSVKHSVID